MEYNIKIFLPNEDNIINAVIINTTNGEARYIPFDDAILIKKHLINHKEANVETIFLGIGETYDIEFEEDFAYTYKVEVIPKRKGIATPPEFKGQPFLYEIVLDKHYKVNYMENEKESKTQKTKEPDKELLLEK